MLRSVEGTCKAVGRSKLKVLGARQASRVTKRLDEIFGAGSPPIDWLGGRLRARPRKDRIPMDEDHEWMRVALQKAREASEAGEVPVGAVVVHGGQLIGWGFNHRETRQDPIAHAEILALQQASRALRSWRLIGCSLYVTLEPCSMCAGAIVNSRVPRLIFGARDPKAGFCTSLGNIVQDERLNHSVRVREGVLAEDSARLLRAFFRNIRG